MLLSKLKKALTTTYFQNLTFIGLNMPYRITRGDRNLTGHRRKLNVVPTSTVIRTRYIPFPFFFFFFFFFQKNLVTTGSLEVSDSRLRSEFGGSSESSHIYIGAALDKHFFYWAK